MRICVKCHHEKPLEQFKKLHGEGYSGYCEGCRGSARKSMRRIKTKEQRTEAHRQWRKGNPKFEAYVRMYNLKYHAKITLEQYQELFDAQRGVCAICSGSHNESSRFKNLHVDHCHTTGKIRGLLCANCNTALGLLKDSPLLLSKAIEYLGGQLNMQLEVVK